MKNSKVTAITKEPDQTHLSSDMRAGASDRQKAKLSDIEKLMRDRAKDYPNIKINTEANANPNANTNLNSDQPSQINQSLPESLRSSETRVNGSSSSMSMSMQPMSMQSMSMPHDRVRQVKIDSDQVPLNESINQQSNMNANINKSQSVGNLTNNMSEGYQHPLTDPQNDLDKYIKPSEYLRFNSLPQADDYMIDYNLSLDIRNDGLTCENHVPEYVFKFTKFGNISKIELTSVITSFHHILLSEPYLFVNLKELEGRCHLSNGKRTFGKIMLINQRENGLIFTPDDCFQTYSRPIAIDQMTFSFCDSQGIPINIREIKLTRVVKSKTSKELIFECAHLHYLKVGDKIEVQVIKQLEIESYEIEVSEVINELSLKIPNNFDSLTNQIRIFRSKIDLCLTFKFSEINWFLLNDDSIQSKQIVRLSELIKAKGRV